MSFPIVSYMVFLNHYGLKNSDEAKAQFEDRFFGRYTDETEFVHSMMDELVELDDKGLEGHFDIVHCRRTTYVFRKD